MVKVTGPAGQQGPQEVATPSKEQAAGAEKAGQASAKPADDGFSKAASGLLGYKSSPLVSGAMKIFSDGVVFPPHLTDPKDPRNDPKYLRLLAAVLGLDELEKHFFALEGEEQEEYLAHKAKQREEKLAKVEKEKEEKRRRKQEAREGSNEEE